jgi:alkylation response protein AidB-like acyl-CoA dehydrogenase
MTSVVDDRQEAVDELRGTLRRYLERHGSLTEARRLLEGQGYSAPIWSTMSEQLGLQGLLMAEKYDGAEAGWSAAAAVMEEMGRSLLPSAYLASVILAATAVEQSKDEELGVMLLPAIASGETTAALAVLESDGRWDPQSMGLTATRGEGGYLLNGRKSFVLDGQVADVLVVAGHTELGPSLFVVEAGAPGLVRTPLPTLDPTRPQASLDFEDVVGRLLGAEGQAGAVLAYTYDRALLAIAADALGGADRCLELSLAYARERVAFGRPIGAFQTIKHKLSDLYLEIEFARAAVERAARAADDDLEQFPLLASLAMAHCVETYALVATETIHIHGGIGFTWEHDAQLFFRRAQSSQVMFGHPAAHRERIAGFLLDNDPSLP